MENYFENETIQKIKEDLKLFYNDLAEYRYSEQGQAVYKAQTTREQLKGLEQYWQARHDNQFTYASETDREQGKQDDKMMAEYLHCLT